MACRRLSLQFSAKSDLTPRVCGGCVLSSRHCRASDAAGIERTRQSRTAFKIDHRIRAAVRAACPVRAGRGEFDGGVGWPGRQFWINPMRPSLVELVTPTRRCAPTPDQVRGRLSPIKGEVKMIAAYSSSPLDGGRLGGGCHYKSRINPMRPSDGRGVGRQNPPFPSLRAGRKVGVAIQYGN